MLGPRVCTQCHDAHHRLFTTAAHRGTSPPASHRCGPAVSEATSYTFDQTKIARSTATATTILALRSSIRRQLRRPAHPLPKPPPSQIPIDGNRSHGPRGFLPGGLSDAGPQCARIGHHGPASETLHQLGRFPSPPARSLMGHFDPFSPPRLNGRCLFGLADLRRSEREQAALTTRGTRQRTGGVARSCRSWPRDTAARPHP